MPPNQRNAVRLLRIVCLGLLAGLTVDGPVHAQRTPPTKAVLKSVQPSHVFSGHSARLTSVAFAPDGLTFATAAWDASARLWDVKTGKELNRLDFPDMEEDKTGFKARLEQIAFSPDNAFVVTLLRQPSQQQVVVVWKRNLQGKIFEAPGNRFAISPDGKLLAVSQIDDEPPLIQLFELATGRPAGEMDGAYTQVDLLAFSPDGKTLYAQVGMPRPEAAEGASRKPGAQIRVWDVATGNERKTALEGAWNEFHLAVAPNGRMLAVKAVEKTYGIGLREVVTSGQRAALLGHSDDVTDVAFSPDGRTLASASADKTVRLWDLLTGQEIARLTGHRQWILSLAFSPDGGSLVAGGIDKTALVWDVGPITRRPLAAVERSAAELEADWNDLAGDPKTAYAALGRLVASPQRAVPFLGQRLRLAEPTDGKRIDRLIRELDADQFQTREQAMKELIALADVAVPALEEALTDRPSLELKRRLNILLERLSGSTLSADTVHHLRAVETLEWIGNREARQLLETIASTPHYPRARHEARLAADRLAKRTLAVP